MDAKQKSLLYLDKAKTIEQNLARQYGKAEYMESILKNRIKESMDKHSNTTTGSVQNVLFAALCTIALGLGISVGGAMVLGLSALGLAMSGIGMGLNIYASKICKTDMKNIRNALLELQKHKQALESHLDFVRLKVAKLERISHQEVEKINEEELEKIRNFQFEGKTRVSMPIEAVEKINKAGGLYSNADDVDLVF